LAFGVWEFKSNSIGIEANPVLNSEDEQEHRDGEGEDKDRS
jgi:hypothetical protein